MKATITRPPLRICKTVGALLKQLELLPRNARLSEPMRPVYFNVSESAKAMGLKPQVGFEMD